MSKFGFTPEEIEALQSSLTPNENTTEPDEKEQKKNTAKNLVGFTVAFLLLIVLGYAMVALLSQLFD